MFVNPEIIMTTDFFFNLPLHFRLKEITCPKGGECELLDIPESLRSSSPISHITHQIRFLRAGYPHSGLPAKILHTFPEPREVLS